MRHRVCGGQGEMSRRTKQPPAAAEFGFAETQRVVSNPIFFCGENGGPSQPKPRGDQLRRVYGPGAVAHDQAANAAGSGIGNGKPLPLPPCRAHRDARVGPAVVVGGPLGRVLRRAHHHQDPFLAAYVACSKGSGGENGAKMKRNREEKKTTTTTRRKGDKCGVVRGCAGIWKGWAASAMNAGAAMSCKNGCAVVNREVVPVAAAREKAEAGPTLDLSWAPVVLSARARERRREQR